MTDSKITDASRDRLTAELLNTLGDVFDEARMAHVALAERYVHEIIDREVLAAFAAAQEKERADVVAWLRRVKDLRPTDSERNIAIAGSAAGFADLIARGQHKSLPEPDRDGQPLAD